MSTPALVIVPSPRLRGEGCSVLPRKKMGEGDSPLARSVLKVPLTQPGIVEPDSMPSPQQKGVHARLRRAMRGTVTAARYADAITLRARGSVR